VTQPIDPQFAESARCPDSDCPGVGEPESDGFVSWCECQVCGLIFAYRRNAGADTDGVCAVGVPDGVRLAGCHQYGTPTTRRIR